MKPEVFKQLQELMDSVQADADKAFSKGVVSRSRSARKALSEIAKLSKEARKELLTVIHNKQKG